MTSKLSENSSAQKDVKDVKPWTWEQHEPTTESLALPIGVGVRDNKHSQGKDLLAVSHKVHVWQLELCYEDKGG